MRKLFLSLFVSIALFSCSTDDSSNNNGSDAGDADISDSPLSGELFGEEFIANGSRADYREQFGENVILIQLSNEGLGCETGEFSGDFPISIATPTAEGTYDKNVYVTFTDPNSSDFISTSGGIDMEVISVTEETVEFKISVKSGTTANNLEGKYTATFCGE